MELIVLAQSDLGRLLAQTGWVARIVLLILLGFSIVSWAIIFRKYTRFRRARAASDGFLQTFRATQKLPEPQLLAGQFRASPLLGVYTAAVNELQSQLGANPHGGKVKDTGPIAVALQLAAATEVSKLEHWMSFLATTGSVTPFIGLFGTVWGVIDAFMGLGEAGVTTLRAVAPGIAEALVATAAGLFAAIPAVIAYNHFLHQIREFATRMDNFSLEFLVRVEKLYS